MTTKSWALHQHQTLPPSSTWGFCRDTGSQLWRGATGPGGVSAGNSRLAQSSHTLQPAWLVSWGLTFLRVEDSLTRLGSLIPKVKSRVCS